MNHSVIFGVRKELLIPQLLILGIVSPLHQLLRPLLKVAMATPMVSFLVHI